MPLLECTQVRPTTRVFGPMPASRVSIIEPVVAVDGSSNSAILRMLAPARSLASRIDS